MLASLAGILEGWCSFFEALCHGWSQLLGAEQEKASQEHPPEAIHEGDRDLAIKIPPSHMRWGRSADTLVLKSYCITLCDGCDPLCGAEST